MGNLKQQAANFANKHESKFRFAWFAKLALHSVSNYQLYQIAGLQILRYALTYFPASISRVGNLLRQRDHIERLMLEQPPQDDHLRAQHVAF